MSRAESAMDAQRGNCGCLVGSDATAPCPCRDARSSIAWRSGHTRSLTIAYRPRECWRIWLGVGAHTPRHLRPSAFDRDLRRCAPTKHNQLRANLYDSSAGGAANARPPNSATAFTNPRRRRHQGSPRRTPDDSRILGTMTSRSRGPGSGAARRCGAPPCTHRPWDRHRW